MNRIQFMLLTLGLCLTILLGAGCTPVATDAIAPPPPPSLEEPPLIPDPPLERDEIMDFVTSLSLEQKIGQLLIVGFAPQSPAQIETLIKEYHVGGGILFRRNFSNLAEMIDVVTLLNELSATSPLPLFIGIDEEGGTVSRLPEGGTKFPDARMFGLVNDLDLTLRAGQVVGRELRSLGVNINFAPVLDVYLPGTSFLYQRSYGTDPELVTRQGLAFMDGMQGEGVLAVPKHFPGHGATPVDSHLKLPIISADLETVTSRELKPFVAAIANGAEAIMAGHLAFPALDPSGLPATRSKPMLTGLLREELGFNGLIITDDIEMQAYLNGATLKEAIVQTVNAGADLIIMAHSYDKQVQVLESIKAAVQDGTISEEQLDASVARIVRAKEKYRIEPSSINLANAQRTVGAAEHKDVLGELLQRLGK